MAISTTISGTKNNYNDDDDDGGNDNTVESPTKEHLNERPPVCKDNLSSLYGYFRVNEALKKKKKNYQKKKAHF